MRGAVLELLVAEVALLVVDCQLAFEVGKKLINHKIEAFQNESFDCHSFACLPVFLLFGSLVSLTLVACFFTVLL